MAAPSQFIGDLEMRRIASFQAIQKGDDDKIHREYTRLVFIDVVDMQPVTNQFPDETIVQYTVTPKFKEGETPVADKAFETKALMLPTTINPTQMPKLIGAGVALSPYNRTAKYSASEPLIPNNPPKKLALPPPPLEEYFSMIDLLKLLHSKVCQDFLPSSVPKSLGPK
jgi:hypothetical protein